MTADAREPLTTSVEDYLKAIYHLSDEGRPASTSDIAHRLALAPASVSGMIKRLSEQGLLEHAPYRGVQLTGQGRRLALRMVRRHRLIEAYLVQRLGYTWDTVHEEAERLEHAVSDTLVERMAAALGNPGVDPHGDPIPSAEGELPDHAYRAIADVPVGETVRLSRVDVREPERLRWLAGCGLTPGAQVTVLDRQPFAGPITLRAAGREHVIAHELGRVLLGEAQERPSIDHEETERG